jgi:hypothetical protein
LRNTLDMVDGQCYAPAACGLIPQADQLMSNACS